MTTTVQNQPVQNQPVQNQPVQNRTADRATTGSAETGSAEPLRARLRHNAAFSGLGGIAATAGCLPVASVLGLDRWWPVLGTGIGLLGFAAYVWWASTRRKTQALTSAALQISLADVTWVAASAAIIATGVFGTAGVLIVAGQAIVVGWMGATQLQRRRTLGH